MQCQQLQTEGEVYDLRVASFSYVPCVGFSAHVEIAHRIVSYRMYWAIISARAAANISLSATQVRSVIPWLCSKSAIYAYEIIQKQ